MSQTINIHHTFSPTRSVARTTRVTQPGDGDPIHHSSQSSPNSGSSDRSALALEVISTSLANLRVVNGSAPVPALQEATVLAMALLEDARGVRVNRFSFIRLAQDTSELVLMANSVVTSFDPKNLPGDFVEYLHSLTKILRDIYHFSKRRSSRKAIARFLTHQSDSNQIAEYHGRVNQVKSQLATSSSILLRSPIRLSKVHQGLLDSLYQTRKEVETRLTGGTAVELTPLAESVGLAIQRVYDCLKDRDNFDDLVGGLARDIILLGGAIQSINTDPRMKEFNDAFLLMERLLRDAAMFIVRYVDGGLATQGSHLPASSSAQAQFNELDKRFKNLKDSLVRVSIQTSITVISSDERVWLDRLNPVAKTRYEPDRTGPDSTPLKLLGEIEVAVTHASTTQPLVWIRGLPGSGKSSIARSLAQRLNSHGCLGAAFFCRFGDEELRNPQRVLPTLAAHLAISYEPFRKVLLDSLRKDLRLAQSTIPSQFRGLLQEPLSKLHDGPPQGPFVIIVDALDECGQATTRRPLLHCLQKTSQLTSWLKVVVTSRPIPDIYDFFTACDGVNIFDLDKTDTHDDVLLYITDRLKTIRGIEPSRRDELAKKLADRAQNLFIWAKTALDFIEGGVDPMARLDLVLSGDRGYTGIKQRLSNLYTSTLQMAVPKGDDNSRVFKMIMGTIISLHVHLPIHAIGFILGRRVSLNAIENLVDRLQSILHKNQDGTIQVLHSSVVDFLTSEECPPEFFINLRQQHVDLAVMCLEAMKNNLRFNICQLPVESSRHLNRDIPDLVTRVEENISLGLRYSCIHWADHLSSVDANLHGKVASQLRSFFIGGYVLYWIEVLGLMGELRTAVIGLPRLINSFRGTENELCMWSSDVYRFVFGFYEPISLSTTHLYLSCLPMSPTSTGISKQYLERFSRVGNSVKAPRLTWSNLLRAVQQHTGSVYAITFSPDGKRFASGSQDKSILIWDAETCLPVLRPLKGHSDSVLSVAFSPDGRLIASGSDDKTIRLWDVESGALLFQPLEGHKKSVLTIAFSPDGRQIVSGSDDMTIQLWDVEKGLPVLQPLVGHTHPVLSVSFSPNGEQIVSGSADKSIRVWDTASGMPVMQSLEGPDHVRSITLPTDGQGIVAGSDNTTIQIWDSTSGMPAFHSLEGFTDHVQSVAFSSDAQRILSSSHDRTVRIWDVESGVRVSRPLQGDIDYVRSIALSIDGKRIITGSDDGTIQIWAIEDTPNLQALEGHPTSTRSITSPDESHAMSDSMDVLRVPAMYTPEGHTDRVQCVTFSPDGRRIASGSDDMTIRIWDIRTGKQVLQPLAGHNRSVLSVSFSPDGERIVSGSDDKTIRVWNTDSGSPVLQLLEGSHPVHSVVFSPNGRLIVSGSGDGTIRTWSAESGMLLQDLNGHVQSVHSLTFSPDARHIVSGSKDKTIRIWDVESGMPVLEPLAGHTGCVRSVSFSRDGQQIVSGSEDKTIRIWDAETGIPVLPPIVGHTDRVHSVSFSPDGQLIMSGSADMTIRIWVSESGKALLEPLEGHTDCVQCIAVSQDGRRIVTGSYDHSIRVWDVELASQALKGVLQPSINADGWLQDQAHRLLFWVPPDYRRGFFHQVLTIPSSARHPAIVTDWSKFFDSIM